MRSQFTCAINGRQQIILFEFPFAPAVLHLNDYGLLYANQRREIYSR